MLYSHHHYFKKFSSSQTETLHPLNSSSLFALSQPPITSNLFSMNLPILYIAYTVCPFVTGLFHLAIFSVLIHVIECVRTSFLRVKLLYIYMDIHIYPYIQSTDILCLSILLLMNTCIFATFWLQ